MLALAALALVLAVFFGVGASAVARIDALDYRGVLVVVAAALVVGGVAAHVPAGSVTAVAGDGDGETATTGDAPTAERLAAADASESADHGAAATANDSTRAANATVVGVHGGDWLTYRTAAGERRTVRLAGIDAPGSEGADPDRFDGVLTGERGRSCLAERGRRALIDTRASLVGESVTVRTVGESAGATRAVVSLDGRSVNRRLVARGGARATDGRYADAERAARSAERGVWACTTVTPSPPLRESNEPGVRIAAVHPNPPGDDAASLADEYVVVENAGEVSVDLSNWYLVDGDGNAYFFFDGRTLRPGEELVVHVGAGRNAEGHVYWGASNPVLDNDHETLKLVDGDTERTVRLSY